MKRNESLLRDFVLPFKLLKLEILKTCWKVLGLLRNVKLKRVYDMKRVASILLSIPMEPFLYWYPYWKYNNKRIQKWAKTLGVLVYHLTQQSFQYVQEKQQASCMIFALQRCNHKYLASVETMVLQGKITCNLVSHKYTSKIRI